MHTKPRERIRANHNKHASKPKSYLLFTRTKGDKFAQHKTKFQTYREAVVTGQTLAGFCNFYVDTGDWVPPRSVQLLELPTRTSKLTRILDTI